jgi:energy-coupling factor transporter ATP-binding protein EcfA2
MFVGRQAEISRFIKVVSESPGQTVLVVGHWGMGKSELLRKFAVVAENAPAVTCCSLHYDVARTDHVDSTMSLILDDAIQAAGVSEGSLARTPRRIQQLGALLNCFGKLGDLVESLRYNPHTSIRDQFLARMEMVSNLMPANRRLIIFIDPHKEMQPDSDQSWSIVVGRLPPKIKLVFAQRPEDALASSPLFLGNTKVVRIPEGSLGGL